nr:hypothetical protein [Tanacetum cinerariifolium]
MFTQHKYLNTKVTLTPVNHDGQQQSSSVSSQFVTSMFNPSPDACIDSLFESTPRVEVPVTTTVVPLLLTAPTLLPPSIPIMSQVQQAPAPTLTTAPSTSLQDLPNFGSLFGFDHRLNTLEANFSEFMQTNQFAKAVSFIPMKSNKSIHRSNEQRNLYKALVDAYECDKIILDTHGDTVTLKRCYDDEDKDEEPSNGSDRGSKRRRAGAADDQSVAEASQHSEWFQKQNKPPTLDRAWKKALPATHGSIQPWISDLAKQADSRALFNELMDTPVDFSAFFMNRLNVDTLTPELLAGPTYELMKGSCKSLVELEFFLEEVYKATTDQLDWNNPEGQQYPHNLLKPLPVIPNSRGYHVIPFDHFINNDLEYLRGGASSRKYTTSVTKTKAADYGHIKWIEDLFYGFVVNRESARDVYSKRRIIAVTKLHIVEWHNYKHLDWITMRRDDDKLYKFKEGNLKRLRMGRGATVDTTNELLSKLLQQLGTFTTNTTFSSNSTNTCVPTVPSPSPNAFLTGHSHFAGPIISPVTPPGFPAQPMAHTPNCYYGLPHMLGVAPSPSMAQLRQPMAHTSLPTLVSQPASSTQIGNTKSTSLPGQATNLPHAFSTVNLQDLAFGIWNMNTGVQSWDPLPR